MLDKRRALAALFLLTLTFLSSCKVRPEDRGESSAVKADSGGGGVLEVCPCSDLNCWREETKKRSMDSFKCAKDMIGTAFPVLDIPLSMGFGAIEIAEATDGLKITAESFKEGAQLAKVVKEFAPACTAAVAETSASALNLVAKTFEMVYKMKAVSEKAQKGEVDFKSVQDALTGAVEKTAELVKLALAAEKIAICFEQAKDAPKLAEATKSITKFKDIVFKLQKPWGEMTKLGKLDVANKLGKCGISIVKGGWAAGQNIGCMLNDFEEINKQRAAIGKALAFEGTRLLNNARWAGCRYCLSDVWYNSAGTDKANCQACCNDPNNNPLPEFESGKRGYWTEECKVVCGVAYTEGVFTNYTDARVCKERIQAFTNDQTGHVYRYIDLLDAGEREKSVEEQKQIAGQLRARAIAYIDVIRANYSVFDRDADGLIHLSEMQWVAKNALKLEKPDDVKQQIAAAASFYGQEYLVRQDEIRGDELPYIRASVGKPYFFVLLETATDGATVEGNRYDDLVGTSDLDGFRNEIGQYKVESETR